MRKKLKPIPVAVEKLPSSNTKDAQDFYEKLKNKVDSCKGITREDGRRKYGKCNKYCIPKNDDSKNKNCEGKRIGQYLERVVPDWETMNPTRLYAHMQSTLDNAEEIRRFEIELIWKRATYSAALLLPFFTAFAYLADDLDLIFELGMENVADKFENFEKLILACLAFTNLLLSSLSWFTSAEGYRWQRNWEHHVDYLQEILGVRLMRLLLRKSKFILSVGLAHRMVLWLSSFAWFSIFSILMFKFYFGGELNLEDSFLLLLVVTTVSGWFVIFSYSSVFFIGEIAHAILTWFRGKGLNKNIYMRSLENFDFNLSKDVSFLNKATRIILVVIFIVGYIWFVLSLFDISIFTNANNNECTEIYCSYE